MPSWVVDMEVKKAVDVSLRIAQLDKQISSLYMELMKLDRERARLSRTLLNELYQYEQTI